MAKSADAFRTISEVADWLGVPTHVLRFWESKFPQVKPVKRAGGRRYYRPSDMLLLAGIRVLLHDDGVTIRGVQKVLREKGVKHVTGLADRDVAETDDAPPPTSPAAPPEPPDANIVDLPRTAPSPQVVAKVPEGVAAASNQTDTVLEVEDDQMGLFTAAAAPASVPPGSDPDQPDARPAASLPGPSPVGTAALTRLRAMTALPGDGTAADLRQALVQHRANLQALRDQLASAPPTTGSDPEG
ncbi:MerR family transcriptional regulator [Tropicimonas sp. S265A]|uniref:MerR family transcriptional regulator n=1 Tax=Tropicimonas sp. S265A TaxID=3415134 RepID=UPI003C7E4FA1